MDEPLAPLMLLAAILAFLGLWWLSHRTRTARAVVGSDGVQEATIVVRNRYRPCTVVVKRGIPLRLLFDRQEDHPCSERVIFSDLRQERWLAPFATSPVQFIPTRVGEFLFTCGMGMYQGWLVVEEPKPSGWVTRFLRTPAPGIREPGSR